MNDIDYGHASTISQEWACNAALVVMRYTLDDEDEVKNLLSDIQTLSVLNAKQWERLATFFVLPHAQMDPRMNFNFKDLLAEGDCKKVMNFVENSIHKKVLEILILDHERPFVQRHDILNQALDQFPRAPLWEPKPSLFGRNYVRTFNELDLRTMIELFVGHHLSINHPLFPYPLRSHIVHTPTVQPIKNPRTQSTGPM